MKKIICFLLFLIVYKFAFSQQQLLYSFEENPQTLLLNPGAETNYKHHYGIPLLSGINLNIGSTGVNLRDLFLDDGTTFDNRFQRALDIIQPDDYINLNARIDALYGGFRLNERDYLSFGFYEEIDIMVYVPKDFVELFYYGNERFLNRPFSVSQVIAKADFLGVFHAGISRKMNSKLNIGARAKIYSSSFNAETNHNSGTFTTFNGDSNILKQTVNNANGLAKISGLADIDNARSLIARTFLGRNYGIGFDFGLTYHLSPQLEFTGSILDIGFVRHSKNAEQYSVKGDYLFDGIDVEFDSDNLRDYWQELQDDFKSKVPSEEHTNAYTSWRPTKINAALKYSFGEVRSKFCYVDTYKKYHSNSVGFQVHTILRPLKPQFSFTSFFETSFSKKVHTKFTHTINDYSSTIIGSGITVQIGKVNLSGFIDNILKARNLETANTASFNFGINFVTN